jgi:NitT/TauT family transport system permease protein
MSVTTASSLARVSAPFAIQAAFVAGLLIVWHLSISRGWIDTLFLASPVDTARAFIPTTIAAEPHLAATFSSFAASLVIGVLAALIIGLLVNASRYVYTVFMPLLVLGVIIPKVTLLPLFVLWFGIEKATIIVYGALSAFFPMVVNVSAASREVKPAYFTLARAMGYTKLQTYLKIVLPAMLPVLTSGLFYACNAALMGVFIVELVLARFGIGAFVRTLAITFRTQELYAAIILTSMITVIINMLLWSLARRFSRWRA